MLHGYRQHYLALRSDIMSRNSWAFRIRYAAYNNNPGQANPPSVDLVTSRSLSMQYFCGQLTRRRSALSQT